VVVAGQSHDTATAFSTDALAWRAHRDDHPQPLPVRPTWLDRLQQLDPARVVFAHDHASGSPRLADGDDNTTCAEQDGDPDAWSTTKIQPDVLDERAQWASANQRTWGSMLKVGRCGREAVV
jgi:hypothetical protein